MHPEDAGRTDARAAQPRQDSYQRKNLTRRHRGAGMASERMHIAHPPQYPVLAGHLLHPPRRNFVTVTRLHRDELNTFQRTFSTQRPGRLEGQGWQAPAANRPGHPGRRSHLKSGPALRLKDRSLQSRRVGSDLLTDVEGSRCMSPPRLFSFCCWPNWWAPPVECAHGCDVSMVAEGVETADERAMFPGLHVDPGRDRFFGRPQTRGVPGATGRGTASRPRYRLTHRYAPEAGGPVIAYDPGGSRRTRASLGQTPRAFRRSQALISRLSW